MGYQLPAKLLYFFLNNLRSMWLGVVMLKVYFVRPICLVKHVKYLYALNVVFSGSSSQYITPFTTYQMLSILFWGYKPSFGVGFAITFRAMLCITNINYYNTRKNRLHTSNVVQWRTKSKKQKE